MGLWERLVEKRVALFEEGEIISRARFTCIENCFLFFFSTSALAKRVAARSLFPGYVAVVTESSVSVKNFDAPFTLIE